MTRKRFNKLLRATMIDYLNRNGVKLDGKGLRVFRLDNRADKGESYTKMFVAVAKALE